MAVDDHGLEALKKAAEEVTPGDKSDYYFKVADITSAVNTSTNAPSVGITVSTSAVIIIAANTNRRGIIITNNSNGTLFLGKDATVTTSGATMGTILTRNGGAYNDAGDGLYTGAIWGIYSESAATQNVAVSERT